MIIKNFWVVIFSIGIGTFFIRASFIYLSKFLTLSEVTKRTLSYIPSAMFPALFAPMVFFHQGHSETLLFKERLIALLLVSLIAYKAKNILVTISSGLVLLFVLKHFFA